MNTQTVIKVYYKSRYIAYGHSQEQIVDVMAERISILLNEIARLTGEAHPNSNEGDIRNGHVLTHGKWIPTEYPYMPIKPSE